MPRNVKIQASWSFPWSEEHHGEWTDSMIKDYASDHVFEDLSQNKFGGEGNADLEVEIEVETLVTS